jgi:hypothetical protein
MSGEWDADTLMKIIAEAIRYKDWDAVIAAIKVLATVDACLAQDVYDTIQAGLVIGHARGPVVGYLAGGQSYAPEDVVITRQHEYCNICENFPGLGNHPAGD